MPAIAILERLRQEDCKFEASLVTSYELVYGKTKNQERTKQGHIHILLKTNRKITYKSECNSVSSGTRAFFFSLKERN